MSLWQKNKIFKDKFICIGDWNLNSLEKFPHCDFLGADTETKLYYKNKLLTEDEAHDYYQEKGAKWCRTNIVVNAYAFMIANENNFALFTNIEDFLLCVSSMLVKKIFWYNTKFDFAIFDYYFVTNDWKTTEEIILKLNGDKKKFPDKTYQSLNGEFGQRYQMRIWKEYKDKSYHKKVHNFKMIDICNIFQGGLKKNLEDWKIVNTKGKEVRKLTMDYVNANVEDDIQYLIADTQGLYLLAEKIEKTIFEISGFSLFKGDYITAGGLAKKSLLRFMFKNEKPYENIKAFKYFFPITISEDKYFRDYHLYQGGKCLVSPYQVGKILNNIYKYDINSMYPSRMRNMLFPVGKAKVVKKATNDKDKIYIYKIKNIYGYLKENMIPVWYDTLTKEYTFQVYINETHLFWKEELEELEKYYYLEYEIEEILEYKGIQSKGVKEYIDTFYNIKRNSKGVLRNGAKLFLNSAYGKLAQKIEVVSCQYELSEDGYVHLVKGKTEIDEKSMLNVVVGSRVTALSRVLLMEYILEICKNNPKKYFVYCDTDSVHSLCEFKDTDNYELGKMKSEGIYQYGKYLAPKTYLLYNNLEEDEEEFEVHSKGVNTNVVKKEIEEEFKKTHSFKIIADEYFKSGKTYKCLTSLNCIGGKALIYIDKMLLNPKLEKSVLGDDERID